MFADSNENQTGRMDKLIKGRNKLINYGNNLQVWMHIQAAGFSDNRFG